MLKITLICLPIVLLIFWICMECFSSHFYIGVLSRKDIERSFTYDSETTKTETDSKGDVSVTTEGNDETTAHINYRMEFLINSKLTILSAGRYSATVDGNIGMEAIAMAKLMSNHLEPSVYTHGKIDTEYAIIVRGWLCNWGIIDMTDTKLLKAEAE